MKLPFATIGLLVLASLIAWADEPKPAKKVIERNVQIRQDGASVQLSLIPGKDITSFAVTVDGVPRDRLLVGSKVTADLNAFISKMPGTEKDMVGIEIKPGKYRVRTYELTPILKNGQHGDTVYKLNIEVRD